MNNIPTQKTYNISLFSTQIVVSKDLTEIDRSNGMLLHIILATTHVGIQQIVLCVTGILTTKDVNYYQSERLT